MEKNSENQSYPSLFEQGKNLSSFTWDLLKYLAKNEEKVLFVNEDVYEQRTSICKTCDKYDESQKRCIECGCYISTKAKFILDSCPLDKWGIDESSWGEKFENITKDMENQE